MGQSIDLPLLINTWTWAGEEGGIVWGEHGPCRFNEGMCHPGRVQWSPCKWIMSTSRMLWNGCITYVCIACMYAWLNLHISRMMTRWRRWLCESRSIFLATLVIQILCPVYVRFRSVCRLKDDQTQSVPSVLSLLLFVLYETSSKNEGTQTENRYESESQSRRTRRYLFNYLTQRTSPWTRSAFVCLSLPVLFCLL